MNPAQASSPTIVSAALASALALALATAASADPVGEAFVVEQYAYAPSAAWGNGTYLAEFTLADDAAVRRLGASGVSGSTSPVLRGGRGDRLQHEPRRVARGGQRPQLCARHRHRRGRHARRARHARHGPRGRVAVGAQGGLHGWAVPRELAARARPRSLRGRRGAARAAGQPAGGTIGVSDSTLVSSYGDSTDVVKGPSGGFLVLWTIVRDDETEDVVGQRISSSGAEIGTDDFRVSFHTNLVGRAENSQPAAAWNSARSEWMVVYTDRYEIFGQRLSSSGSRIRGPIRLSQVGPDGDTRYVAWGADVAYSTRAREYLVVWIGTTELGEEDNTDRPRAARAAQAGSGARTTSRSACPTAPSSSAARAWRSTPTSPSTWSSGTSSRTRRRPGGALSGRPRRSYPSAGRSRREAPAASDGARLSGTSRVSASSSSSTLRGGASGNPAAR